MKTLHFVTNTFPPTEGGLEKRLQRLTSLLSANGFRVFLYLISSDEDILKYEEHIQGNIIFKLIGPYKNHLEGPLRASHLPDNIFNAEKFRVDCLVLSNLISTELINFPQSEHLIVSNYLTTCGFIASNVSAVLEIPHLACIVGTDFSKGYFNPFEKPIVVDVITWCDSVLTLNFEVAKTIRKRWPAKSIFTIHTSVKESVHSLRWIRKEGRERIRLFSDCGYCHKKATQTLLWSFERLLQEGYDVELVICGKTNKKELTYWEAIKTDLRLKYSQLVTFHNYVDENCIYEFTTNCDLFCYPTLGEGCSNSRLAALCIGVPIVTTMCGEIVDLARDVSHVFTCLPGNHLDYYMTLRHACDLHSSNEIIIDEDMIACWRRHLTAENEMSKWIEAINYTIERR